MGSIAIEIAYALLPPMLLAMAVAGACHRVMPREAAARWHLAAGAAAGMLLGYVLLPEWAPLAPERHWHWLAYLAAAAAVLGAATAGRNTATWERLLVMTVLGIVAALTLVPTWDTLQPPRRLLIPLVAGYIALLYALLAALPPIVLSRNVAFLLAVTAFGTAALVGYEVSVKFGQLGGTFAASLAGVTLWIVVQRPSAGSEPSIGSLAEGRLALASLYAFAIGGLAFVATIEPAVPATPLLIAPAAPVILWLFVGGPLSRIKPLFAAALQALLVILVLVAVAVWLYLRTAAETDEWSDTGPTDSCSALAASFLDVVTGPIRR